MNWRSSVVVLLLAAAAAAQETKPDPIPLWQRALDAYRGKDETALAAVAASSRDPWLTADELCSRHEMEAAVAFARAVKQKGCEKLGAYVGSRRDAPSDETVRKAYAAADAALRAHANDAALAACQGVKESIERGGDVVSLQLAYAYGYALRAAQQYDDATDVLGAATKSAESLGWIRQAIRLVSMEAQIEARIGNALLASGSYHQAVDLAERLGDKKVLAGACMDATTADLECEIFGNALATAERARALHEELGDKASVAGDMVNIGIAHLRSGRLDDALAQLQKGLDAALAAGQKQYAASAMSNLGVTMTLKRQYDKAVEWNERARALKEELHDERGVAGSWANVGKVRMDEDRLDDARAAFEKALVLQEKGGWLGDAMKAHRALGRVALRQKRAADAVVHLERALEIVRPTKFMNQICQVQAELGVAYAAAQDKAHAEEQLREAWPFLDAFVDPEVAKSAREAVARLRLHVEGPSRTAPSEPDDGGAKIASARRHWKSAQDALAKDEKGAAMGELRDAATDLSAGDSDTAAVRAELDAVFRTGVRMGVDVADPATVYWFLALRRGRILVDALADRNHVLLNGQPLSAARVKRTTAPGTAYVCYGVFEDETFAVVIGADALNLVKLGPTKAIAAVCAGLDLTNVAKDPEPSLAELRKLLVAPLQLPATVKRISVGAPDEPLANLPFALLLPERDVVSLPTPEIGLQMVPLGAPARDLLVLGSAEDAAAWHASRLDPATTTWEALLEKLRTHPAWSFVALGAKIVPDPDDAQYSALQFAGDGGGRKVIDGATLAEADLPVAALFLTEGAAGHGVADPGEGAWRLSNECLMTGATGVIASLWEPDPAATRALVGRFLESLNGRTRAAALRDAQDFIRHQPRWAHPRFWAGWVLTGTLE